MDESAVRDVLGDPGLAEALAAYVRAHAAWLGGGPHADVAAAGHRVDQVLADVTHARLTRPAPTRARKRG